MTRARALAGGLALAALSAPVEAGISVPFPQRDVHVRSVAAELLGRAPKT